MPSPQNEPDRYSMKWIYAPNPPRLASLKEVEAGERFTQKQQPIWSIAKRLDYDKKMAATRSPGPKYEFPTNVYKKKSSEWNLYRGERTWFNKPKKGNGENFAGLSPKQLSTVEMTHPLLPKQQTATLNNYNPRADDKTVANLPPGYDPGRYPANNKDAAMYTPPNWTIGTKNPYIVGAPAPGRTANVPVRNISRMRAKGGTIEDPAWTIRKRIPTMTQDQKKFPSPAHYDQSKNLTADGSRRNAPAFGFGTNPRFPKPRFG